MIVSLSEYKAYLKITSTELDTLLSRFLRAAQSEVEDYCNNLFESIDYEESFYPDNETRVFLKHNPISAITKLEKLVNGEYADQVITGILFDNSKVFFKDSSTFELGVLHRITYTAGYKSFTGTGTISALIASKEVTGVTTAFVAELKAGDNIICDNQVLIVDSVGSDTSLTLKANTSAAITAKNFVVNNVPNIISEVITEIATINFYNSPAGKGRLGVANENVGSQATQSFTFKELDWKARISNHVKPSL